MKQPSKQDTLKLATEHAYRMWKTGSMTINQAVKLAAKQYKVDAEELASRVFEYTNNKSKGAKE